MLPRTYKSQHCSVARSLELIGERWTLLVIRDAFLGVRRFDDFQRSLGVARNVLTARLELLVEEGILERRRYQQRPERFEYRLTEDKGLGLWPVLIALVRWGDEHLADGRPPRRIVHRGCGGEITERLGCEACGAALGPRDVEAIPGPGSTRGRPVSGGDVASRDAA